MSHASPPSTLIPDQGQAQPQQGFELLQTVYVRHARPELGIQEGERGTVVELFERPRRAYYVEFVDEDGTTRAEGAFTADELAATPPYGEPQPSGNAENLDAPKPESDMPQGMFLSAKLKIAWGKDHLAQLNRLLHHILQNDYFGPSIIEKEDGSGYSLQLGKNKNLPYNTSLIIGDVIHNLRSAFDHVATEIVGSNSNSVYFPFHEKIEQFAKCKRVEALDQKCQGLGDFIVKEIRPYKEGNFDLWSLTKLDAIDKHRFIVPTLHVSSIYIEKVYDKEYDNTAREVYGVIEADRSIRIAGFPGKPEISGKIGLGIEVLFPENSYYEGENVLEVLSRLCGVAESSLLSIESFVQKNKLGLVN